MSILIRTSATKEVIEVELAEVECDTGMSGQRRSDGNIELFRFLDSHEGGGARAVFASIQLLYKNNFPNDPPSKFAHH